MSLVNKSLRTAKTEYYESQIELCRRDTKAMVRTVNTLMGNNRGCLLPVTSDVQIASDFSDFCTTKISTIRDSLYPEDTPGLVAPLDGDVR